MMNAHGGRTGSFDALAAIDPTLDPSRRAPMKELSLMISGWLDRNGMQSLDANVKVVLLAQLLFAFWVKSVTCDYFYALPAVTSLSCGEL